MKTTITAVIFDMDGVLFDTERMYMECWREAAEPRALKMWTRFPKPVSEGHCRARRKCSRQRKQSRASMCLFEELHEDCSRRFKEKEEREGLPRSRACMRSWNI